MFIPYSSCITLVCAIVMIVLGGCTPANPDGLGSEFDKSIKFHDDLTPNSEPATELSALSFTRPDGTTVPLSDFIGEKSIVLVVTQGNTEPICPYCSTQTARLIANYGEFQGRNAEVVVIYPVDTSGDMKRLDAFLANAKGRLADPDQVVPFPVLIDVELHAVDALGIRKRLAKPATYILDPGGHVRFAYVGEFLSDRPSIKALLAQLDAISA